MTTEARQITARLAAASEVFPIAHADGWDSRAYVSDPHPRHQAAPEA